MSEKKTSSATGYTFGCCREEFPDERFELKVVKLNLYQKNKVREYWIIDSLNERVISKQMKCDTVKLMEIV